MKIVRNGFSVIGMALIITACFFAGGCASLMLREKERALDEAFEKGKIDKIKYNSLKSDLQLERAQKGISP